MFLIERFMYSSQDAVQKINLLKKKMAPHCEIAIGKRNESYSIYYRWQRQLIFE